MKILNKYKYFFYCVILSFVILLFTSKSSFLYIFNDWVDANAFFSVGKGIFNGVVPYKDILEQKGLLLFLIYGIGYLISNTTFHGIFILEVISFSFFLYYSHKTICLFLHEKYSLLILPIISFVITTSLCFTHGGSCEEFCFPFIAVSLYYFIRHFKEKKLSNFEIIINGVMAGIVFMMKYTILGFWIGFVLFIFIYFIKDKKYKEGIMFCIKFLIGMMIPVLFCVIYFLVVDGLGDYIFDYFYINIFMYKKVENYNIFVKIWEIIVSYNVGGFNSGILAFVLTTLMPFIVFFSKKEKDKFFKIGLVGLFVFTSLFIYYGLLTYKYYYLPITIFTLITFIYLAMFLKERIDKVLNKKIMYVVFILTFLIFSFLSFINANYKEYRGYTEKDLFQFKYASYIKNYENPTLINMGFLDVGVYTLANIVPSTKYFQYCNIDHDRYPTNRNEIAKSVKNRDVSFVIYIYKAGENDIPDYVYDNYDIVYIDNFTFENRKYVANLFKMKGLN